MNPCAYTFLGSDSSATTASAMFFYLAHNREAYNKVANVIRTTFAAFDEIRPGMVLSSCSYLHACITETLRLSPPTVGAPWRDVQQAGISINGELIPANCEVGTYVLPSFLLKLVGFVPDLVLSIGLAPGGFWEDSSSILHAFLDISTCSATIRQRPHADIILHPSCIYAIHRHPEYFADPDRFLPERWLPGTPAHAEQLSKPGPAMTPFGIGGRNCPGRFMALLNVSLAIARTIWLYDFRKADGKLGSVGEGSPTAPVGRQRVNEYQLQATITSMGDGPYLVFQDRLGMDRR